MGRHETLALPFGLAREPATPRPQVTTRRYPIQYEAGAHVGAVVLYDGDDAFRGQVAMYYDPVVNQRYPHLKNDGVSAEVYALQPAARRGVYARVCATRPDGTRSQRNSGRAFVPAEFGSLEQARAAAIDWMQSQLDEAYTWLALPVVEMFDRRIADMEKQIAAAGTPTSSDTMAVQHLLGLKGRRERLLQHREAASRGEEPLSP